MTKADLVEQVADAIRPRVTKRECGLVVNAFLDAVKDALARGDGIELRASAPSRCGTARPATPGPERQSRFRPAMCRSSNLRGTSAAAWTGALACPGPEEPLEAVHEP